MKTVITKALPEHAKALKLRACDLKEATEWVPGDDPIPRIEQVVEHSKESFTLLYGDDVAAIGGYSVHNGTVSPWMLGSPLLKHTKKTMYRAATNLIAFLKAVYPDHLISNYVAKDNEPARKFLLSLGFTILPAPGSGEFDFFYLPNYYHHV
jgi:hypothetical protein